jgi:hypothetical protein
MPTWKQCSKSANAQTSSKWRTMRTYQGGKKCDLCIKPLTCCMKKIRQGDGQET